MATAPFTWGSGGEVETDGVRARRRLAAELMKSGTSTEPVQHWTQGMARVAQALYAGMIERDEDAKDRQATELALSNPLLAAPGASPAAAAPMSGVGQRAPSTTGKIYSNDEPSPLDPPSGAERDAAIRTVVAEAGNQGPVGMNAVGSVIRNRAVAGNYGGDTATGVVTAPSQFEPWNTAAGRANMAAIDPNSPRYQQAGAALDQAYFGNDPTNGATHFYAPKAQAALGRPAPAWDNGTGTMIGDHRFFGGAGAPTMTAGADPAALPANAQPTQGYLHPTVTSALNNPNASEGTKAIAAEMGVNQLAKQGVIPEDMRLYIRSLIANPRTRADGQRWLQHYATPKDATWGETGATNPDGTPQRGFIDTRSRTVTPYVPAGANAPGVIPPPPPGVDPALWRKQQTEAYMRGQMPGTFEDATKLRGEVQGLPSYKNLAQAAPVYRSMADAAGRDTRAADNNLIYGLAKVLDPGSVVRESEMTIAQAIATLPEQFKAAIESNLSGTGRLTPEVRAAIMKEARSRVMAYQGMFSQDADFYRGVTQRNRLNADDIIPSFGEFPEWSPGPAVGAPPPVMPQSTAPAAPAAGAFTWDPNRGLNRK